MVRSMVRVYGNTQMAIAKKENSATVNPRAKGFISLPVKVVTRKNSKMAIPIAQAPTPSKMVINVLGQSATVRSMLLAAMRDIAGNY
ncbi:MAG TPA: hypothetical protein V6D14_24745 [Coleofasciculaceae cyanobacterium]|jgi:RNase P/RNase MRP subunit POP5